MRQSELTMKNVVKEKQRDESIVHTDEKGNLLWINKSLLQGTLRREH